MAKLRHALSMSGRRSAGGKGGAKDLVGMTDEQEKLMNGIYAIKDPVIRNEAIAKMSAKGLLTKGMETALFGSGAKSKAQAKMDSKMMDEAFKPAPTRRMTPTMEAALTPPQKAVYRNNPNAVFVGGQLKLGTKVIGPKGI